MFQTLVKTFLILLSLNITLHAKTIDIDSIIDTANKENKHLFVWLHKTDCAYCERMKEYTLIHDKVSAFIKKHFIYIYINVSKNDVVKYQGFLGSGNDFAKEVGYNFYPTSLFFDNDKEIIFSEVGYVDCEEISNERHFFKVLNFIQSKAYEEIELNAYTYTIGKDF